MRVVLDLHERVSASVDPVEVAEWIQSDHILSRAFTEVVVWPAPPSDDHDVTVHSKYSEMISGWLGIALMGPHVPGDITFEMDWDDKESLRLQLVQGLRRCAGADNPHADIDARVAIAVERLVYEIKCELAAETSRLRDELEAARIRIGYLEGQLDALSEAKATGRKRIVVAALALVTAILAGASEGAVGTLVGGAQGAQYFVTRCGDVRVILDETPDDPEEAPPVSP